VTVTVYVPALSPVTDGLVEPVLQAYAKGAVPPEAVVAAVPLLIPQVAFECAIDSVGPGMFDTDVVAEAVQPIASVIVTE
jgi:hypothetical protein